MKIECIVQGSHRSESTGWNSRGWYSWVVDFPEKHFADITAKLQRNGLLVPSAVVLSSWPEVEGPLWYPFHSIVQVRPIL